MSLPDVARIAALIDHTLLKPEATAQDIDDLCAEAHELGFVAVCINPVWVARARAALDGSAVRVATVVGFPLGANATKTKAFEAELAVSEGADELDMVASIGHIRAGDWAYVAHDISEVVSAASGRLVKVILETALLDPVRIVRASETALEAGAGFVKTSTGFNAAGGATVEAVQLMSRAVGRRMGVKASGGIRDCGAALRMLAAGATRLGTSSGVRIVRCLDADPTPLAELVAHPERHAACKTAPDPAASSRPTTY